MPFAMLDIAYKEGIEVEYWDFKPPLEGIYIEIPDMPPIIGISYKLFECSPKFRCVLAEELGHHFTMSGNNLPKQFYHYRDRLIISKYEYKAIKWAAEYLIPLNRLNEALHKGTNSIYELAEYFNVTKEMVEFRINLPDF